MSPNIKQTVTNLTIYMGNLTFLSLVYLNYKGFIICIILRSVYTLMPLTKQTLQFFSLKSNIEGIYCYIVKIDFGFIFLGHGMKFPFSIWFFLSWNFKFQQFWKGVWSLRFSIVSLSAYFNRFFLSEISNRFSGLKFQISTIL